MAEFELGLMRQRAQEALRQMIARGENLWEVPVGYLRSEGDQAEMTPDRQVREANVHSMGRQRQITATRRTDRWLAGPSPESRPGLHWFECQEAVVFRDSEERVE